MALTLATALSLLGAVFAMVESNQQKRKAQKASQDLQKLMGLSNDLAEKADELKSTGESKDTIIDSLLQQRNEAQAKIVELTLLLNNNQEYILALEDKAIAEKASKKKVIKAGQPIKKTAAKPRVRRYEAKSIKKKVPKQV